MNLDISDNIQSNFKKYFSWSEFDLFPVNISKHFSKTRQNDVRLFIVFICKYVHLYWLKQVKALCLFSTDPTVGGVQFILLFKIPSSLRIN